MVGLPPAHLKNISSMIWLLSMMLSLNSLHAGDTLFVDDFSSGELERNWIFYGDPQPRILDSLGLPAPCFNNNGDSMYGSGAVSRSVFEIAEGLIVECDMYLECSDRGTWVTASLGIATPGFRNSRTPSDYSVACFDLSYSGELDWARPHLQTILKMITGDGAVSSFLIEQYHQNHLLNSWHNYRIEIGADLQVTFFIDDSLAAHSNVQIPDTVNTVRIHLGDRSSDWGIALHDNLIVYRP